MTRTASRAHFTSARLIRQLADHGLIDAGTARPDFADRLGQWLSFADAMELYAAHGEAAVTPCPDLAYSPADDYAMTRQGLADGIAHSLVPGQRRTRLRLPEAPAADEDTAMAHEPYRRFHFAHQREMEQAVTALRVRLRAAAAMASPALARLARLDAAFENAVGERESRLLAGIPRLLQQRFALLRAAPLAASEAAPEAAPDTAAPDAWLGAYYRELESFLLAELDLRLQPALGLVEALGKPRARPQ